MGISAKISRFGTAKEPECAAERGRSSWMGISAERVSIASADSAAVVEML